MEGGEMPKKMALRGLGQINMVCKGEVAQKFP